jgi:hypothetical protein
MFLFFFFLLLSVLLKFEKKERKENDLVWKRKKKTNRMKRYLTTEEIQWVCSDIRSIQCLHPTVSNQVYSCTIKQLYSDLSKIQLVPSKLSCLKDELTKQYYSSQIQPGESVGIETAQSIGERQTQLALDSFHTTGITTLTVVAGVPRFTELISATKNPKHTISTIYPRTKCTSLEQVKTVLGRTILHVTFNDFILRKTKAQREDWYDYYYPSDLGLPRTRYILNKQVMYAYRLTPFEIVSRLRTSFDFGSIFASPTVHGIIDVDDLDETTWVNGIPGITEINYSIQKNGTWVVEALGGSLGYILAHPSVDETKTFSNDMWEILSLFGIEATREFLVQEFLKVISVDSYINQRHVELLVDVMLHSGTITSISRYGMSRIQSGALSTCSFEESLDQILKAGLYGEDDTLKGVSGSIICGKISNAGTGLCDLIYSSKR